MNEPKTLEQQLKESKAEIAELKKKLSDRNPAFNSNLLNKADKKYDELCDKIGKAIVSSLNQDLIHVFKTRNMYLDFDSGFSHGRGWIVKFEPKEIQKIKDGLADYEMRKFQESLDNFAWAVENQGQG